MGICICEMEGLEMKFVLARMSCGCNNPSPLLADIVSFGSLRIVVRLMVLKCVY